MIEVTLITGRSIGQGEAIESGKELDTYPDAAGICELDEKDMGRLGVEEGEAVTVSTPIGSIVLKAVKSTQGPHEGIAFIPLGPWANAITNFETDSTGMPSFKGINAKIAASKGKKVLSAAELVRRKYPKGAR
ncbi:MAG: molybdopterin dinucleotide binding domain-containing protein [Candidatus Hydrothermarchaeaceae archaeon]